MQSRDFDLANRKIFIVAIFFLLIFFYIGRLFVLQVVDNKYKEGADSNAFFKKTRYPPRGAIYDRNGELLVYNQPSYDVTVIMREMRDAKKFDTLAFCDAVGINIEYFRKRMEDVQNRKLNKNYSSYKPQIFITQLSSREYGVFQQYAFKFPGFYVQSKTIREYGYPNAAHVLGYIAEVDKRNLEDYKEEYYVKGDYIGKTGIEKQYESDLRGEKGVEILLRDAHGRIKGTYENGIHDKEPVQGKDLTLSLDIDLQAYGEMLMQNKMGSIIMIEPQTGEILCMVSVPTYDPSILVGRQFSDNFKILSKTTTKPLINRAVNGTFPPGSTFKPAQALVLLEENIIQPSTAYSCHHGFPLGNGHPACHGHASPLALSDAIGTSCNSYFCWGLKAMLDNKKYGTIQKAIDTWRERMNGLGFGQQLGIDLPDEKRGRIPGSTLYDKWYNGRWNPFTVISNAIGQGEVEATPLQICNLAASIANRGFFYTPHIVKKIKDTPLNEIYTKPRYTGVPSDKYECIVDGMRLAVTQGTCSNARIPDIEICGKTGTAENFSGKIKNKDHSLFMAFAPKDNPRVAIAVLVENGGFGNTYAVPIGRLMIEKYLNGKIADYSVPLEEKIKTSATILSRYVLPKK
ncbi:MAG: penicillin-binding protein 2 [Dysgonamonadaceae bacterium]|jgi:penicillin-binding protein 2|nr:penicillin-binding protein 2 [Dysgonamonadaceae bacterium]